MMRRVIVNLILAAAFLLAGVSAYAKYYYTEPASYGTPTNLGPIVNSPNDVESLQISRDGLSLYFSSQREGGYGDYDLWVTRRATTDANWGAPENLGSPPNSEYAAWMPSISGDELTLYFSDGPYGNIHPNGLGDGDIWVSTRASPNDPWGEYTNVGEHVDANINNNHVWAPCVSADGLSLYLSGTVSGDPCWMGYCDLYVSTRETTSEPFGVPVNLGPNINSSIQDHAPDISADELTLFFSRGDPWNDGELWVATRKSVSEPWGPAVQLPPHVDIESCFDVTPSLSPDGSTLYFTSHRPGGCGEGDIWQVQIFELDVRATDPSPTNGATDVPDNVVLGWSPRVAATSHDVYFGTSFDDVNDANTSSSSVYKGGQNPDANSYDPCGRLDLETTYYWRIDEFDDPCLSKGNVWSFTTGKFIVVDDMEQYTDFLGENPISLGPCGWECGFTNQTGAYIDLWTESPTRGTQAMRYAYANNENNGLGYYAEIKSQCLDPCDWSALNVKSLTLWFYGDPDNDANATEQMYVAVEDDNNTYVEVRYGDHGEDMNDIKIAEWQEWNIDLNDFNDGGVMLSDVNHMYIGFGQRYGMQAGGLGTVYFDDIRLYLARCVPEFASTADFTDDCLVNFGDFAIVGNQWLKPPGSPSADIAQPPDGIVDMWDLALLVDDWLQEKLWPPEE